jgi:hypothetical protein
MWSSVASLDWNTGLQRSENVIAMAAGMLADWIPIHPRMERAVVKMINANSKARSSRQKKSPTRSKSRIISTTQIGVWALAVLLTMRWKKH